MKKMKNSDLTPVEFIEQQYNEGHIATNSLHNRIADYVFWEAGKLPENDNECREMIFATMKKHFELNKLNYDPNRVKEVNNPFIDYVKKYAKYGSLSQQFKEGKKVLLKLPWDDTECRAVITKAMDVYFQSK